MGSKLKIGSIELENKVILGPMAGVTDFAFRQICKEFGVGLMVTEMVSAKAICYNDKKTHEITLVDESERPVALQLFGSEPLMLAGAVEILNDHNADIFDINMGCPAPKIVKNGDGSALMKNPHLIERVVSSVVKVSKKPVTVKIRKGWDETSINAVEVAKIAESCGAVAITVHGRTRDQFYSGVADWDIIKSVKHAVDIPVIGNGDVFSVEDAMRLLEITGCDGIMVARGAAGNPWLLRQIAHFMETGVILDKPTAEEKIEICLKHLDRLIASKGEHIAVLEMRKHAAWYIKGIYGAAKVKNEINNTKNTEILRKILLSLV